MTTLVHIESLGCSRNDVDSEELAGRLAAEGFELAANAEDADVIVVNTCGFIEQAKKDSIDTLLAAADLKRDKAQAVVAVGCMAERYGSELASALPEADAVLGFDAYPQIAEKLRQILAGQPIAPHVPSDRRKLLPLSPVQRRGHSDVVVPGHANAGWGPRVVRRRLGNGPFAPLKIASGCDRRCAFCAIPSFRGAFTSREIAEIVDEARWLVDSGVREVMLVSENSSSYGKDLGDREALVRLLLELNDVDGLERIRVSYLQPAELRPGMLEAIAQIPKVTNYFDLSFQHASTTVLRSMRRFGDAESFLAIIDRARELAPECGIRSNVIVGFPGETRDDIDILKDFCIRANMDVVGVFAYSDEEGTEGAKLPGHVDPDEIAARRDEVSALVDELCNARAADRVGTDVRVLVESVDEGCWGRAEHQGPEVDGQTSLIDAPGVAVGDIVSARVVDSIGVDLVARRVDD